MFDVRTVHSRCISVSDVTLPLFLLLSWERHVGQLTKVRGHSSNMCKHVHLSCWLGGQSQSPAAACYDKALCKMTMGSRACLGSRVTIVHGSIILFVVALQGATKGNLSTASMSLLTGVLHSRAGGNLRDQGRFDGLSTFS